jgi:alkylhydroperoxidase family enzyme
MARRPQLREHDPSTPPEAREFRHAAESTTGEVFNALRLGASVSPMRSCTISGTTPFPAGVYSPAEAAVVRYAQRSTKGLAIDASSFRALVEHFSTPQIIDICLNVGLSQITNRFNATFSPGCR